MCDSRSEEGRGEPLVTMIFLRPLQEAAGSHPVPYKEPFVPSWWSCLLLIQYQELLEEVEGRGDQERGQRI